MSNIFGLRAATNCEPAAYFAVWAAQSRALMSR
jgi:hypothetical protein